MCSALQPRVTRNYQRSIGKNILQERLFFCLRQPIKVYYNNKILIIEAWSEYFRWIQILFLFAADHLWRGCNPDDCWWNSPQILRQSQDDRFCKFSAARGWSGSLGAWPGVPTGTTESSQYSRSSPLVNGPKMHLNYGNVIKYNRKWDNFKCCVILCLDYKS